MEGLAVLFCYKHVVVPTETVNFVFRKSSYWETSRFEGNKIHCFPRDQSSSDLLYSFLCCGIKHSLKNAPSTRGEHQSRHNHATFCHRLITWASGHQCTVTL